MYVYVFIKYNIYVYIYTNIYILYILLTYAACMYLWAVSWGIDLDLCSSKLSCYSRILYNSPSCATRTRVHHLHRRGHGKSYIQSAVNLFGPFHSIVVTLCHIAVPSSFLRRGQLINHDETSRLHIVSGLT